MESEEKRMGEEKKGFFGRLVAGLTKTRNNIVSGIDSIFGRFSSINEDFYEELEEILTTLPLLPTPPFPAAKQDFSL